VQSSSQIITTNKPTPSLFLQARCASCHPTNSVKALKGNLAEMYTLSAIQDVHYKVMCRGGQRDRQRDAIIRVGTAY